MMNWRKIQTRSAGKPVESFRDWAGLNVSEWQSQGPDLDWKTDEHQQNLKETETFEFDLNCGDISRDTEAGTDTEGEKKQTNLNYDK